MQYTVFVVTILLMLVVTAAFAIVALNASKPAVEYAGVQEKSFSVRAKVFWAMIVAGVLIAVITTLDLPYAATRGDVPDDAVTIGIEGRQWLWLMDEADVGLGDTVVFDVSAFDVNHGLGVYDPDMTLIGQTQAMPGYVNSLQVTLDRPGTYSLLCMEYCGLSHHIMLSQITVGEEAAAEEVIPAEDVVPAAETVPAEAVVPAEVAAPAEEAVPAEEIVPAEEAGATGEEGE